MCELRERRQASRRPWFLMLPFLLAASSQAFGQIQPISAELTDSTGTVIGEVLDYRGGGGGVAVVAVEIDGHPTILEFLTWRIDLVGYPGGSGGVYFASTDCTGQAYTINQGPNDFFEPQAVAGPQFTFYAGPSSPTLPPPFTWRSFLGSGNVCRTDPPNTLPSALPVYPIRTLTPPWQPPFRLTFAPAGVASVPAVSSTGLAILGAALGILGIVVLRWRAKRRIQEDPHPPASAA